MPASRELGFSRPTRGLLLVRLAGSWRLEAGLPALGPLERELERGGVERVAFDTAALESWDSGLLGFLFALIRAGERRQLTVDRAGLPEGARRLLDLAGAVPERGEGSRAPAPPRLLARLGGAALETLAGARGMLAFLGEVALGFGRLARGRARLRGADLAVLLQDCGAGALPIVTLISFLVGLILAFVGALQLEQFGAQIFVADLVGLGMAREMGAMMTAVIMAGRTGAAFAAELGTMTVNEEVDALATLGIPPIDFLALPRILALALMMPLLVLYADLIGILGGLVVGVGMLGLGFGEYYEQTVYRLTLADFGVGLVKGAVFGVLVALAGCQRGIYCGRSARAVGQATTSAVVTAIVSIVVADAILTVIYNVLDI